MKPKCQYGAGCYRTNVHHLTKFDHDFSKETGSVQISKSLSESEISDCDTEPDNVNESKISDKDTNENKVTTSIIDSPPAKKAKINDYFTSSNAKSPKCIPMLHMELEDIKAAINEKYLINMPKEFYSFFEFCKILNKSHPENALLAELKLKLVGPFELLIDPSKIDSDICWLTRYRYFHDPPEMTTIIKRDDKSQYHLGYFRDDPKDFPAFVVSTETSKSGSLKSLGANIFAAINLLLDESNAKKNPSLKALQKKLVDFAKQKGFSLETKTKEMKQRDKKSVCKTLHNVGLVVPVDENDIGYRPLPSSSSEIVQMLEKIVSAPDEDQRAILYEPLDEMITYVQFANDECDYGEGIELGLDLLAFHPKGSLDSANVLNSQILNLLELGYNLVKRPEFSKIVEVHMKNRRTFILDD